MKVELFKLVIMLIGFPSKIKEAIIKGKKAKKASMKTYKPFSTTGASLFKSVTQKKKTKKEKFNGCGGHRQQHFGGCGGHKQQHFGSHGCGAARENFAGHKKNVRSLFN